MIEEAGCQVCGLLTRRSDLTDVNDIHVKLNYDILDVSHYLGDEMVTRKERKCDEDPVEPLPGPVLDRSCEAICGLCISSLKRNKMPKNALARGLWVGEVPEQLSCLTFAEKLLVSRIRTNHFVVRASSGMYKMSCNAISYASPTPKVYKELPPP